MDADLAIMAFGPLRETALPILILSFGGGGGEQAEKKNMEVNASIKKPKTNFVFISSLAFF
jgi:hypothetical protein